MERGIYRNKVDAFIATYVNNEFKDAEKSLKKMLTNESFWRLNIFDKEYNPPRIDIGQSLIRENFVQKKMEFNEQGTKNPELHTA